MAELMDMPIEIVVGILSLLDHDHAQNMRWSCKALQGVYQDHRVMMRGPKIEASIRHFNNETSVSIRRCSDELEWNAVLNSIGECFEEDEWKTVPTADWDIYFRNAEVNELAIETDSVPPMDLYHRMFLCKSIKKVKYDGDHINQEWLDIFNQLARDTFSVTVKIWPVNLIGSTKMQFLVVRTPITHFDQISNALNTISCFCWKMEMPVLETAIEILRTVEIGRFDIKFWSISNDNRAYGGSNRIVLEFARQVQRISKKPLQTIIDEDNIEFHFIQTSE